MHDDWCVCSGSDAASNAILGRKAAKMAPPNKHGARVYARNCPYVRLAAHGIAANSVMLQNMHNGKL